MNPNADALAFSRVRTALVRVSFYGEEEEEEEEEEKEEMWRGETRRRKEREIPAMRHEVLVTLLD